MKSRQSETKTNLQAIKTSKSPSSRSEAVTRHCCGGVAAPVAGTKTTPFTWGVGVAPTAPGALWCVAAGVFAGTFNDIGFKATGNVMYRYGVDATTVAAPGLYTTATSCPLAIAGTAALGAIGNNNVIVMGKSNLDGDAGISTWDASIDHGANDCTTGVF